MTQIFGADLIGKRESVTDQMLLLNPHTTPLLSMLGFANPIAAVEHNWFEDTMFAQETTVAGAVTNAATTMVVASTEPFRVGAISQVGEELVKVTAINEGTKTLTVSRGYAGTTPAAVTDGSTIEFLYVEGVEGADARSARSKKRVRKSNLTQIFDDTVEVSGTAAAVAQYGITDLYEYEKAKKIQELSLQLEKAMIGGIKNENGNIRQMAGLRSMIQTNVKDAAGAALSLNILNDSLQAIYEKGGFATGGNFEVIVPAKQKRAVGTFDKNLINIDSDDQRRGTVVSRLITDFGEFPVSINNNLNADELMIIDKNRTQIHALNGREFGHEYLGKRGDYYQGMIVGEYTLELHQEQAHSRIKGLA
ncbi:SU10 major capsid protein [Paenibacillus wulumuqiensis]|uniref:SU10 major capsid protein n=1 Tax=Paenibacillus wulumuqiensis TaxID=1567107 RepID=UPI00061A0882|nr:DUF5309 family protein [Paenibacillus wulumuqiensis]